MKMDALTIGLQVLDTSLNVGSAAVSGLDTILQLAEDGDVTCEICRCEWD
jgi:hypothetical protein